MNDRYIFGFLVLLAVANFVQHFAEMWGWYGDPNEQHVSHISAALIWGVLAWFHVRIKRGSDSRRPEDG